MKKNLIKVMILSAGVLLASCGGQPNSVDSSPSASESSGNSQSSVTVYTYAKPTYAWSDDNSTCTATRLCNEDQTKNETETVYTAYTVIEPATCEEDGKGVYDAAFENPAFDAQSKDVVIPKLGHEWGDPEYTWNDDNSTCTATRVCLNDPTHIETETVDADVDYIKEPTCTEEGTATFTAIFENEVFKTQTKTASVEPTGHTFGEPTYEWSDDNSTCTATHICLEDETHVETETVDSVHTKEEPTCDYEGKDIYTATFENEAFEQQVKEVAIKATGHTYGEPSYEWSDDNSTCTAVRVCVNDEDHLEIETVEASHTRVEPSCTEEGKDTYTATFKNPAFAQQVKEIVIEAISHDYGDPTYTWAADNSTCTAKVVCANDSTHVVEETVNVSYSVTKDPTEEADGTGTYKATFENSLFKEQTKDVAIDSLPTISKLAFTKKEDGSYSVKQNGTDALAGKIKIPASYGEGTEKGAVSEIAADAFANLGGILEIVIPESVVTIGNNAFKSCEALQTIHFNSGSKLTSIGNSAFQDCKALTSMVFPKSVQSLGEHVFDNDASLESISFEEGSQLKALGGYCFSTCPKLRNITFAEGTVLTSIAGFFMYQLNLDKLELPEFTCPFPVHAISGCEMKSLTFPVKIGDLYYYCLNSCYIPDIYYKGTMEQWAAITKAPRWTLYVDTAVVHCSDGDVAI